MNGSIVASSRHEEGDARAHGLGRASSRDALSPRLGDAAADEGRRGDGHTPEYAIGLGRDRRRARGIRVEREQVTPASDADGRWLSVLATRARRRDELGGVPRLAFVGRPVHRRRQGQPAAVRNTSASLNKTNGDKATAGGHRRAVAFTDAPTGPVSSGAAVTRNAGPPLLSMGLA